MSFDKCPRFKDPFSTSPLPKSFYYPTPTKDVDANVAIQSQEKKDQSSKRSNMERPFQTGSAFQLAPLPQLRDISQNLSSLDYSRSEGRNWDRNNNQNRDNDEDLSCSTLLQTSQLTSSIDEKETVVSKGIPHSEGNSLCQDGPVSVIQRYVDRFRHSAPKSREERERENGSKVNTFWWMNSDMQGPERKTPVAVGKTQPLSGIHHPPNQGCGGTKLTKDAVYEFDKETSNLQQRADKLLYKSQLSLASSGPCVSTDGLGSSTTLSDCTFRSDPQSAYRPIFVNVQGEDQVVPPREKFNKPEESIYLHPNDVLTRWRMRRKMEDAQQKNSRVAVKHKPVQGNREIDIRLEEFRKKLFAQRVLVTSEDIQFEREKMKMMIDDESCESQGQIEKPPDKIQSQSRLLPLGEDVVLARLRQITGTVERSQPVDNSDFNHRQHHIDASVKKCQDLDLPLQNATEGLNTFDSNDVNIAQHSEDHFIFSPAEDLLALNTNNKATSHVEDFRSRGVENVRIDEMRSMVVCDARQKTFALSCQSGKEKHRSSRAMTVSDRQVAVNKCEKAVASRGQKHNGDSTGDMRNFPTENFIFDSDSDSKHDVAPYHQRLEAEKPCDESYSSIRHSESDDNVTTGSPCGESKSSKCDRDIGESESKRYYSEDKSKESKEPVQKTCRSKDINSDGKNASMNSEAVHKTTSYSPHEHNQQVPPESRSNGKPQIGNNPDPHVRDGKSVESPKLVPSDAFQEKLKPTSSRSKERTRGLPFGQTKSRSDPPEWEKSPSFVPRHSEQSNVHKVIGETVVDHLFDGPSMISSVDSWASLFPQSPAHSFHNSTVVTPTKEMPSGNQTSTPHRQLTVSVSPDIDSGDHDSDEEFTHDPLMNLLIQQKKEYLHKLCVIESKLQQIGET